MSLARTERTALCDQALQVGGDRPTLCGDWTVKDLLVHLVVREGGPSAIGIALPPLAGLTARASARQAQKSLPSLVERVRSGPPRLSVFSLPKLDDLVNTLEFFVHHEDIRRAQPDWAPRDLDPASEQALWSALKVGGRGPVRKANVGIVAENSATGSRVTLKKGPDPVTVAGKPSEVALFVFGRTAQARVEPVGDALDPSSLGL